MNHWRAIRLALLVHFHLHLSLGYPFQYQVQRRTAEAQAACKVYSIFYNIGSSDIPRCDLHTSCYTHQDCSTPGYKCTCNPQCGMICECPPPRGDERQYRVGRLMSMDRCSGRQKCTNASDCNRLSALGGVRYECVCTERCGQVCQATPIVPHTRPGRCPRPLFVYNFKICQDNYECMHDAHCLDENKKCCQSTCGKACLTPVYEIDLQTPSPASPTTTLQLTSAITTTAESPSEKVLSEETDEGFEDTTDVTTNLATSVGVTMDTFVDEDNTDDADDSGNQRQSRDTSRCKTGLRRRTRSGEWRRCNPKHPCYPIGLHPLCGNNDVSYANACYLHREQDRLGVTIDVRHSGYCGQEDIKRGSAAGNDLSKREPESRSEGSSMQWPCNIVNHQNNQIGNLCKTLSGTVQRTI